MVASVARVKVCTRAVVLLYNIMHAMRCFRSVNLFPSPRSYTGAMADAEQQFMETAENGYEGEENGAEGYDDDGGASAQLQAEAGDGENNGEGVQDGDGSRIEASKSEEDAGYVTLKLHYLDV